MPEKVATTHTLMERTLVVYRRERSAVWQCRYKVDGVWQRASTKETDLQRAKDRAKELLIAAEIRKKENLPIITRRFKHCADLAIAQMDYELSVGTGKVIYDTYKRILEDYVVPVLGRRQINSITLADITSLHQSIAEKMGRAPSRSTTLKHNAAINRVFDAAIARNFVTRAQLPELTAHGKESQVGPSFTLKEIQNVVAVFDGWIERARTAESRAKRELLRDYVDVLLDTGARPGKELLDLTWSKINYWIDPVSVNTGEYEQDLESGLDAEEIILHKLNRSVEMRVSGKTGARTLVGMTRTCAALARLAKRNHNISGSLLKPFDELLKPNNSDYVFQYKTTSVDGKEQLQRGTGFEHLFVAFLKEHNLLIDPKTNQSRKLYSLRHTYATLALTYDKVPIHTLAKQMGTSVLMIERHYSDLEPVRAINQLRGEETRRLISAGGVVDDAYKPKKRPKSKSH
jgi:integrase